VSDPVNHPKHYTEHPSGVECIQITEHMSFNLGNAIKYCFRSGNKVKFEEAQDLRKGEWYVRREMESFSKRYKVRSKYQREMSVNNVWKNQDSSSYQEWIHDLYVFFANKVAIRSCDGFRNFCWSAPVSNGRVSFRWQSPKQLFEQSCLGINEKQHQEEKDSQDGTIGSTKVVIEIDDRASNSNKNKQTISIDVVKNVQYLKSSGIPDQIWQKLASFVNHESNVNRAAAIFYIMANDNIRNNLEKAVWYINREIERINNGSQKSSKASVCEQSDSGSYGLGQN